MEDNSTSKFDLMNEITNLASNLEPKEIGGIINSLQLLKAKKEEELATPATEEE